MPSSQTFVIVGAGLAGAKAAQALRDEGFDGRVVLIGSEADRPYERPPLSKEYLRGEIGREGAYAHEASYYAQNEIELRTSTYVTEIDTRSGEVIAADERLSYDRLLLSTGAEPRRLAVGGSELKGVYYLREFGDSDAIAARLGHGGAAVVVGAGWIGSEVAASARQKGLDVSLIEQTSVPLEGVLGPEVGAIYRDIHLDHGVNVLTQTAVTAFEGSEAVERVRLGDGRAIDCDFVVIGVGVLPRTELADRAGVVTDNGILCDAQLATSAPGVFCAGDVANQLHPQFGRLRVEHWANALNQGPAAARNMLGRGEAYARVPYFFSDQYDVGMEYSGDARDADQVLLRGDPQTREFVALWLAEDRLLAAMNVNVWEITGELQELIRSQAPVDVRALCDPETPPAQAAR